MSFSFDDLNTNTGGGLKGPFINWKSKTTDSGPGQSWNLTSKDDNDQRVVSDITAAFQSGVVFNYNTIKLGWEKWAPMGEVGETVWAPGLNLAAFPRPEETKRRNEMGRDVFLWQKTFSIRIAITPDQAGTWNQASFGSMLAFEAFIEQLKAAGPQHPGKLPLVRFTNVREDFGGAKVPVLEIADWKDAPACLKEEIAAVAALNTAAPVAQSQPVAQPVAVTLPPAAATPEVAAAASMF